MGRSSIGSSIAFFSSLFSSSIIYFYGKTQLFEIHLPLPQLLVHCYFHFAF
uniref:Uncharacterized protein n=1 Tax=Kalanchoe fedtschenkoi TaxID=63787 RepID=A0A7N0VK96_KALFE